MSTRARRLRYINAQLIRTQRTMHPVDGHDVSVVLLTRSAPAPSRSARAAVGARYARSLRHERVRQDGTGSREAQGRLTVDSVSTTRSSSASMGRRLPRRLRRSDLRCVGALVATDSYGDSDCHSGSHDMRIDDSSTSSSSSSPRRRCGAAGVAVAAPAVATRARTASRSSAPTELRVPVNGTQVATCTASNPATGARCPATAAASDARAGHPRRVDGRRTRRRATVSSGRAAAVCRCGETPHDRDDDRP